MDIKDIIEFENESTCVDFKSTEYRKASFVPFLKDVISMANANTKDDKFIIIGMKPNADGDRGITGIDSKEFTDAATYQQLVFENIEPELGIEYFPYKHDDKTLGVFRIFNCTNKPYLMKKPYNSEKGKTLERGDGFIRTGTTQRKLMRSDYDLFYKNESLADVEVTVNGSKDKLEMDVYFQREVVFYELNSPFPSPNADLMKEHILKMNKSIEPLFKHFKKNEINKSLVRLEFRLNNIGSIALENAKVNFSFQGNHLNLANTNIVVRNNSEVISPINRNDPNRVSFVLVDRENMELDFRQRVVVGGDNYTTRAFYVVADKRADTNIKISWELLSKNFRKSGELYVILHPKIKRLRRIVKVDSVLEVRKEELEIKDWIEEVD